MGNEATGVANTAKTRANSATTNPMLITEDLLLFSCIPEKSENISIMVAMWCAMTVDLWTKNVVSSTYRRSGMPPGRPVV